jgi:TATA-binding protein-associated factor Taf7
MIDHLATLLEAFPGSANRTCCFTHILNLVAKCIMKQFDAPKNQKGNGDDADDKGATDLQVALDALEEELEDDGMDEDANKWEYDMHMEMTADEIEKLEKDVQPVRHVLTKVNNIV